MMQLQEPKGRYLGAAALARVAAERPHDDKLIHYLTFQCIRKELQEPGLAFEIADFRDFAIETYRGDTPGAVFPMSEGYQTWEQIMKTYYTALADALQVVGTGGTGAVTGKAIAAALPTVSPT